MRRTLNQAIELIKQGTSHDMDDRLFDECLHIMSQIKFQQIYDLCPEVYKLLKSDSEVLRQEAVKTLGYRLHVKEFRDMAYDIWLNDESDEVRGSALLSWCSFYVNSKNKDVLEKLYRIFTNKKFKSNIKAIAYVGFFETVLFNYPGCNMSQSFDLLLSCKDPAQFNKNMNWPAIKDIMRKYVPDVMIDE